MVWYSMIWSVWYAIRVVCYAMRFVCYAIVYVVIDKHSATLPFSAVIVKFKNYLRYLNKMKIAFSANKG